MGASSTNGVAGVPPRAAAWSQKAGIAGGRTVPGWADETKICFVRRGIEVDLAG